MTDAPSTHTPGTSYGETGQPKPPGGTQFFDWVRSLGFVRGRDRWLGGVCGAVAARTGLDPMIVRGIAVVVAILGGPIFFLYAVGWALIPDESGRSLLEQAVHQVFEPAMIAVGALLLLTFVPWMQGIWWQGPPEAWGMPGWLEVLLRTSWAIGLTVGIILLVIYIAKRVPSPRVAAAATIADAPYSDAPPTATFIPPVPPVPDPPTTAAAGTTGAPPTPSLWDDLVGGGSTAHGSTPPTAQSSYDPHVYRELYRAKNLGAGFISVVAGLALSAGAVAASFVADGAWSNSAFLVGSAAALAVIALGIVVAGILGKEGGWLNAFSIILAATMAWTAFIPVGTDVVTFGDPTWEYDTSDPTGFAMIAGDATIDLTELDSAPAADSRTVDVWLAFGEVELVLPENRTVKVQASSLAGGIEYDTPAEPNIERGGVLLQDTRVVSEGSGSGVTTVRVWMAFGQVRINQPAEPARR